MKSRKILKKNGKRKQNQTTLLSVPKLPSNTANIEVNKRIRYQEVTAGVTSIDRRDLINLIVLPLTSSTAAGLLKSVKINRIRMWNIASTATNPLGIGADCTVRWLSTLGKEKTVRSTQMGVAPGYLDTKPPQNSLASFWTSPNSDLNETICDISAEDGTIIDINYSIIFANDDAARVFAITTGIVNKVSYNSFGSFTVQGYQNYTPA